MCPARSISYKDACVDGPRLVRERERMVEDTMETIKGLVDHKKDFRFVLQMKCPGG